MAFGAYIIFSSHLDGPGVSGWDCTGAETACTGTYVNYTGCYDGASGSCHSTTATTTINVGIELDSAGLPVTHYIGGHSYTVKLTGQNGTGTPFPYFGFELTSMKGTASASVVYNAGTWSSAGLPARTWIRFFVWLVIGLVVYYFYSRKRSEFYKG